MKRPLIIGIVILACAAGGLCYWWNGKCAFASSAETFRTMAEAGDLVKLGWLPEFLPGSAHNITEKRNAEQNKVIARFFVDSADELSTMINQAEELPKERLRAIHPGSICRCENWFPQVITKGRFEELSPQGFRLYRIRFSQTHGPGRLNDEDRYWHLLVNAQAGVCYLWLNW